MTAAGGSSAVFQAAGRLEDAQRQRSPCAPVRDLLDARDLAAAYAVQGQLVDRRLAAGARPVGRKIGLTNPKVQAELGVDQRAGPLPVAGLEDTATGRLALGACGFSTGAAPSSRRLSQPWPRQQGVSCRRRSRRSSRRAQVVLAPADGRTAGVRAR
jgi:hypothetical protein